MLDCKKCAERVNNLIQILAAQRDECASKAAELAATDNQQLKAEIAAIRKQAEDSRYGLKCSDKDILDKLLRQLSAV